MPRRDEDELVTTGQPVAEVMRQPTSYTPAELATVTDFESAMSAATAKHGAIDKQTVGFRFLSEHEKHIMVGKPTVIMEWRILRGDYGNDYVEVDVVCQNEDGSISKYTYTDGGTGVCKELTAYTIKSGGKRGGVVVPEGLRGSTFHVHPDTKRPVKKADLDDVLTQYGREKVKTATTYYYDIKTN